jgi:hypothetical protein
MEREALDAFWRRVGIPVNEKRRWRPKPDVIALERPTLRKFQRFRVA